MSRLVVATTTPSASVAQRLGGPQRRCDHDRDASPTTAPTATAAGSAILVGDAVGTRFGTVQVQVTVENG